MTAAVRGPSRQIPVTVEDRKNGKPTLHFIPEEEGERVSGMFPLPIETIYRDISLLHVENYGYQCSWFSYCLIRE